MTSAGFASATVYVSTGPSWLSRWWRAFVRLIPLGGVYMLLVAFKDLPFHIASGSATWRTILLSLVPELIWAAFLVGFIAAVDVMALAARARMLADGIAVLLALAIGGVAGLLLLDAIGAPHGNFSFIELAWANAGMSAVEAAFALVFYRLWQKSRRRASALRDIQRAHVELLRQTAEADLVAMRARMDPAFLFETLHDLEHAYERDPAAGRRLIDALIDYLRAVLPGMASGASTLAKECDIARTYVDVARARGTVDAALQVVVPPPRRGTAFPPMVIMPLVEDMTRSLRGEGAKLRIGVRDDPVRIVVAVETDRKYAPSASTAELVRQRLGELTAGGNMAVSSEANATQILLEIPYATTPGPDR